jgi:hypothetical protein
MEGPHFGALLFSHSASGSRESLLANPRHKKSPGTLIVGALPGRQFWVARPAPRTDELAISPDRIHASGLSGKPDCCWTAVAPETAYPKLTGAQTFDVVIVGAGIVGVTAA